MIDFRQLRSVMASAFDTDNLLSVKDSSSSTIRAENVPCHFVVAQADNPGISETVAQAPAPVVVYGEIYTSETPVIREGDEVIVQKKDTAGNIIATYQGTAGMPAYRAGRVSSLVKITTIVSEEEPEPEGGFAIITYGSEGERITSSGKYAVEKKREQNDEGGFENRLYLLDVRFEMEGNAVYVEDSGLGGRLKLFPYEYGGIIQFSDGVTTYQANASQTPQTSGGKVYVRI